MKRYLVKIELNKEPKAFPFNSVSDKSVFLQGMLKHNPIKNETVFISDKFGKNTQVSKFTFDGEGNCKRDPFILPMLRMKSTKFIKPKKNDKFEFNILQINVNRAGNFEYIIESILEREETHNNMTYHMPNIVAYVVYNDSSALYALVPTFQNGYNGFGRLSNIKNGGFCTLKYDDLKSFNIMSNNNGSYFLFNDNMDNRNNINSDDKIKRITAKHNLDGLYAPIQFSDNNENIAKKIESSVSKNTFYYFETGCMTKNGEFAVIKLLEKDEMLVAWLNAK